MERMLSNKLTIAIMILPVLIIFGLFIPFPFIFSIILSFFQWDVLGSPSFVGFKNFSFLFTDDFFFGNAIRNTFYWLAGSTFLQLTSSFVLAYILSRKLRLQTFFKNVVFLPVTLSGVAVSIIWYFIYHPEVGLLNQFIRIIGFDGFSHAWLFDKKTALISVMISVVWRWSGYYMILYLAGLMSIPKEIIESSKIDGANEIQLLYHIIFPYLLPVIKVTAVLQFTSAFKGFDAIYVMTQGGPNHTTDVLALYMYNKAFAESHYGYGSAVSTILTLLCVISTIVLTKLFDRKSLEG